jgi:hypothetical protein
VNIAEGLAKVPVKQDVRFKVLATTIAQSFVAVPDSLAGHVCTCN